MMNKGIQPVSESLYHKMFDSPSMLPSTDHSNFEILQLEMKLTFNIKSQIATWEKNYRLKKVRESNPNTDQFWEVTGCPRGKMIFASDGNSCGYGYEAFLDKRENLLYRIDLIKRFPLNSLVELSVKYEMENLEHENKLIEIESGWFYKNLILRYDFGYSIPIKSIRLGIEVEGGIIKNAWPKALAEDIKSNSRSIQFLKSDGLRPREIFSPLVQIVSGSKLRAVTIREIKGFIIGVAASIIAAIIYSRFYLKN